MFERIDWGFWAVISGAVIVKLATSPYRSFFHAILTGFAAVFSAIVFTDPLVTYLSLDFGTYRYAAAALVTLTGEGAMRFIIALSNNPAKAIDLWRSLRGLK